MSTPYYSGNGSPLFEAKWAGKCKECGDRWKEGDHIGYLSGDDKPVCYDCHNHLNDFEDFTW